MSSDSNMTPELDGHSAAHHDYIPWLLLWLGFLLACGMAGWQVLTTRRRSSSPEDSPDVEQPKTQAEQSGSSGDSTRQKFYKLLLLALLSRLILLPVQYFSQNTWLGVAATTLPEMTFSSAWALLVYFFVQLVGTATAGHVSMGARSWRVFMGVQGLCYGMYGLLLLLGLALSKEHFLVQRALSALLCAIYASLFGILVYFGPRLIQLLQPSLVRRSGLAMRLVSSSVLCAVIFFLRALGFGFQVVMKAAATGSQAMFLWQCAILEWLPAVALLIMMHPSPSGSKPRSSSPSAAAGTTPPLRIQNHARRGQRGGGGGGSSSSGSTPPTPESVALLKPAAGMAYGATHGGGAGE